MTDRSPPTAVRPFARSGVRPHASLLERCARAQFLAIPMAVIIEAKAIRA